MKKDNNSNTQYRTKGFFVHIGVALALVVSLVLLTDPFMYWMPPMAAMGVLVLAAVLLCIWAGFVMYEGAVDEREAVHRMHAGRIAYLSGIGMLTLALLVQGINHTIDPWVAATLVGMVLSKIGARLFHEWYL
jgi:hypothetical protein